MKQLGVEVTNADGSMKDSVTIQRELHEAFSKLSESEQIAAASAIFGKNQMAPWLAPTIQKVAEFVQKLVDKFNSLTPAQQETIVKIGLIVAAVGPLLVIVGKVISAVGTIMTIVPKISGAITAVKGAFAALNTVMMANPIILIIAALVAAFIYLWNNCEEFRQFWIDLWEGIKDIAIKV